MTTDQQSIDPRALRNVLGRFTTGITIVTTEVDGVVHGMTANAFMSVSLTPPLICISVSQNATLHQYLVESGRYGISILSESQRQLSRHFAGYPVEGLDIPFVKREGMTVIEGALAVLVARVVDAHPAGDHTLFIGAVEYLAWQEERPLVYFKGKYHLLAPFKGS